MNKVFCKSNITHLGKPSSSSFFSFSFFLFFAIAAQAQTHQGITNYDNTEITSPTIDVEQTQTNLISKDQNKKAVQPAESNTTRTNTTKTETNTYSFYFNHKQFLKPVYRKSAYCWSLFLKQKTFFLTFFFMRLH